MSGLHNFSLRDLKPQRATKSGSRVDVNQNELSTLKGLALSLLVVDPKGVREPHWHPNANELSYCLEGKGLMTIFSPGSAHDTFTISPGEIVFVPMGSLHHIENTGDTPLKLLICFDNELPEDLDLSSGVAAMPNHIMGATFGLESSFFQGLKKDLQGVFISQEENSTKPPLPFMTSRYKLNLAGMTPQVLTKGGAVKMSNRFLMPTLEGLSVYSVVLKPGGAREPHWHPNATELNYLVKGTARITLLSPKGHAETFDMKAGDLSFMPRGYLHHIENTGSEDCFFVIFFGSTAPSDIGLSGCLGAYSDEVLASLFNVAPAYFASLPKLQQDLFVVGGG